MTMTSSSMSYELTQMGPCQISRLQMRPTTDCDPTVNLCPLTEFDSICLQSLCRVKDNAHHSLESTATTALRFTAISELECNVYNVAALIG